MNKQAEVTGRVPQSGKMISVRIDPRVRYFAEIAAAAKGESLTKYLESALTASFLNVTLRLAEESDPVFDEAAGKWIIPEPDPEEERSLNESQSVANLAHLLWSESEYLRMLMLSRIAPHLSSEEDAALLKYIDDRKDLHIVNGELFRPDRKKIDSQWEAIKDAFAKIKKGGKK